MNTADSSEKFVQYVEQAAFTSLMDEVSATPKPGLVDLRDSGAHTDMDFYTFKNSAEAIAPYLSRMARAALEFDRQSTPTTDEGKTFENTPEETLFLSIRSIGMEAEQAMFFATNDVNTHKGMIFSMGLTAAAAGLLFSRSRSFHTAEDILALCQTMCRRPIESDFSAISRSLPKTHGERLYVLHGIRGIRGEASDGFPSVKNAALPILRQELKHRNGPDNPNFFTPDGWNRLCLQILLKLMSQVDDTNVLFRTDYASLLYCKKKAADILSLGGSFTDSGIKALEELNRDFIKRNISPGGCADLLAITLFLWRMEQFFSGKDLLIN